MALESTRTVAFRDCADWAKVGEEGRRREREKNRAPSLLAPSLLVPLNLAARLSQHKSPPIHQSQVAPSLRLNTSKKKDNHTPKMASLRVSGRRLTNVSPRWTASSSSTSSSIRGYATPAASASDFKVSSTSSGIKLATLDEGAPTSAITVAIKAGPRYESQPGLAHVLKNFVFKVRERACVCG